MKVKVKHTLTVHMTAVGESEFYPEFSSKVKAVAELVAAQWGSAATSVSSGSRVISVSFDGLDLAKAEALKNDLVQKVVMLAEHGPDGDILGLLLSRHPELRSHPKVASLVGAFENLTGVLKDILNDKSAKTIAAIQQRELNGIEITPEDLKSSGVHKRAMTAEERAQFRTAAIRGQTEEQTRTRSSAPEPEIPEIYRKLAEKSAQPGTTPHDYGPPLPGDEGNVFTRTAKK